MTDRRFAVLLFAFTTAAASCTMAAAAQQPSFSCSQASTEREHAICSTPALSALDAQVAAEYKRVHAGVPVPSAPSVLTAQRAWLHSLDVSCSAAKRKDWPLPACLTQEYKSRLAELQADRPLDDGHWLITTHSPGDASRPEILTPTPAEAAWNRAIAGVLASNAAADRDTLATCRKEASGQGGDTASNMEASSSAQVDGANTHLISTSVTRYVYCGGAHGNTEVNHVNWSLDLGRLITVDDIFRPGSPWKQTLLEEATRRLHARTDSTWQGDELTTGINESLKDTSQWQPARDGLHIHFGLYQVTAYAFGMPEVVVPWKTLEPLLAPSWRPTDAPQAAAPETGADDQ